MCFLSYERMPPEELDRETKVRASLFLAQKSAQEKADVSRAMHLRTAVNRMAFYSYWKMASN